MIDDRSDRFSPDTNEDLVARRPTVDDLPSLLPLAQTERPPAPKIEDLSAIRSPEELPDRLYLGFLDRKSFERTENGWRVDYPHPTLDLGTSLRWNGADPTLTVDQNFFGATAQAFSHRPRLVESIRFAFPDWNDDWHRALRREVEPYNLFFRLPTSPGSYLRGMPDGPFCVVAVPVPALRLPRIPGLLRDAQGEPTLGGVLSASLVLCRRPLVWIEEACPELPLAEPDRLHDTVWRTYGVPPVGEPVRGNPGGLTAVRLEAAVYTLVLHTFLRDLLPLLELLERHRLLWRSSAPRSAADPMQFPEHAAYVRFVEGPDAPLASLDVFSPRPESGRLAGQVNDFETLVLAFAQRRRPFADSLADAEGTIADLVDTLYRAVPRRREPSPTRSSRPSEAEVVN